LGVEVNTTIDKDDAAGVARAVGEYRGTGNILICWNIIIFPILRKLLVSKDLHPVQGGLARPNTQAYGLISFGLHQPLMMRLLKYLARILPG
jgi:hypothetical protein